MGKKQDYINRVASIMENTRAVADGLEKEDVAPWSIDQQRGIEHNLISVYQILDNVVAILTHDMMFDDDLTEG